MREEGMGRFNNVRSRERQLRLSSLAPPLYYSWFPWRKTIYNCLSLSSPSQSSPSFLSVIFPFYCFRREDSERQHLDSMGENLSNAQLQWQDGSDKPKQQQQQRGRQTDKTLSQFPFSLSGQTPILRNRLLQRNNSFHSLVIRHRNPRQSRPLLTPKRRKAGSPVAASPSLCRNAARERHDNLWGHSTRTQGQEQELQGVCTIILISLSDGKSTF